MVEVSILPSGVDIHVKVHHPGSVSDLTIFQKERYFREAATEETESDTREEDVRAT